MGMKITNADVVSLKWIFFAWSLLAVCYLFFIFNTTTQIRLETVINIGRSAFVASNNTCTHPTTDDVTATTAATAIPDFRLLIGILTLADHYERRNLLRLVHGVQLPVRAAHIDIKFVFCNLTKEDQKVLVALEIMQYNDIIILNCTENMNKGKTYTYFSSLPTMLDSDVEGMNSNSSNTTKSVRPYDYVMKADDDIFFKLDRLAESLRDLPREDLYYGFVIPCAEMNPHLRYMAGMGYVLSWDLVNWIRTSDIPGQHLLGPEDKMLGEWLNRGNRGKSRFNTKPAMYDYPIEKPNDKCSHEFVPDTIAVHRLKDKTKWIRTLKYFNITDGLKPSKMYHI